MMANSATAHHPMLAWQNAGAFLMLIAAIAFPSSGRALEAVIKTKACDQASFQKILTASITTNSDASDARAVWLDSATIIWPKISGHEKFNQFKLYYSANGKISAQKKQATTGADGFLSLDISHTKLSQAVATRFNYVPPGIQLTVNPSEQQKLPQLHKQQLLLVQEDKRGRALDFTAIQVAGAIDDIYHAAADVTDFGVSVGKNNTQFKLWAPTAQAVSVCVYDTPTSPAASEHTMQWNPKNGVWHFNVEKSLDGKYYRYLVDAFVPGHGLLQNAVTDPYSLSLSANSERSYIANLDSKKLMPSGWEVTASPNKSPNKVATQTDMVIYELHVRDFSINDNTVSKNNRGKYLAFTESSSNGMRHLAALAKAGLTDVHLLPVFDIASIPEKNCVSPKIEGAADSEQQQAITSKFAASDCFNWGYDPYHFSSPEGSYASDADNGATRIKEFRSMVNALHRAGLRVGMDVVYNHTSSSGQKEKSVLDRIVPGYYHRLDANGKVERSTCCENTATENLMMGKLMLDSVVLWAKHYKIDSFRFDLMGHQPRAVMETLQQRVNAAAGRKIYLIGEGWNFGEVANGARFVQASQLSLNGSGIGTFSDRARDAIRGGSASDSGEALVKNQGYINGLAYDANEANIGVNKNSDLLKTADMIRVGLAGSLREFEMRGADGNTKRLEQFQYGNQPAGYASQPSEVVNYIDNHDNQTLFDINAYKLPLDTSADDRARVQILGMAINTFSQGISYFHAGIDTLRSKSMDGNSYDSGDWFNRLDWNFKENYFATGLPPKRDNEKNYALIKPRLNNALIKPAASNIEFSRDAFLDLLRIRSSSSLFRLASASDIKQRLKFYNTGPEQNPVVLVGHIAGVINRKKYPGAGFQEIIYFINVDKKLQTLKIPEQSGKSYVLHPVHESLNAADPRPAKLAKYQAADGSFSIPARSAVVFVIKE